MRFQKKIVITGIGILSPIGEGKEKYWKGLEDDSSGIREITVYNPAKYGIHYAGEIAAFDPEKYLGKKGLKYLSRTTKLVLSAAFLCLKDAEIKNSDREYLSYDAESMGVVLGSTYGVIHSLSSFDQVSLVEGPHSVSPMAFPNMVMNCHSGYLAIKENVKGLNITVSTGYNASIDAVGIARHYLASDQIKCFLVGGAEELSEEFFLSFYKQDMISNSSYIGEGAAIYAIEKLDDAVKRKAKIYGQIAGYGNIFSYESEGLSKAIELAIEDANIKKRDIDWVIRSCNSGIKEKGIETEVLIDYFGTEMPTSDLSKKMGDSYSAGGSLQIGAGLRLIQENLAKNILTISLDPCGNYSALIIKKL
jgi:3-oxoacyl-[acyl-carrier-protein] synthase II